MADTPLRPDSVHANPEPASADSFRHSRRTLLGAMMVMPAIALPALPAHASASPGNLKHLIREYHRAQGAANHFSDTVYKASADRLHARIAALPKIALPYEDAAGFPHVMCPDDDWAVWRAKEVLAGRRKDEPAHVVALCHRFVAEIESRQRQIDSFRPAHEAVIDRDDALNDVALEACDAVVTCPVTSLSDLAEKIEFIREHGGDNHELHFDAIEADVRRLTAGGC